MLQRNVITCIGLDLIELMISIYTQPRIISHSVQHQKIFYLDRLDLPQTLV